MEERSAEARRRSNVGVCRAHLMISEQLALHLWAELMQQGEGAHAVELSLVACILLVAYGARGAKAGWKGGMREQYGRAAGGSGQPGTARDCQGRGSAAASTPWLGPGGRSKVES